MTTDFNARFSGGTLPRHALIVASAALFTEMLLAGLVAPILPILPAVVAAGPAWSGVLFSSYAVSMVIATVFAGRVVDRHGPKTPLLIGLVGMGLATFLFAVGQPFWLLLVARLAQGVSGGVSWVAAFALIAATNPIETRGRAMGIAMSFTSIGFLVGPPLGGFMAQHWGTASPFILAGAIAIFDGILRVLLVKEAKLPDDDTGGPLAVLGVAGSWSIVLVVIYGAALSAAIEPILPLHLKLDQFMIGLLYSVSAVVVIFANPIAGSLTTKVPIPMLVGSGLIVGTASLLTLATATTALQGAVAMALMGIAGSFTLTPANLLISEQGQRANPPTLGGTFALSNLAYGVGMSVGPLLTGFGAADRGYVIALIVTAGVLATIGAAALPRLPRLVLASPDSPHEPVRPSEGSPVQ